MAFKNKVSEKRLINKKRKAQAFLDLIRPQNEVVQKDLSYIPPQSNSSGDDGTSVQTNISEETCTTGETPRKKIKIIDLSKETESSKSQEKGKEDDVLTEIRKKLRERQKAALKRPKLFLTLDELTRDSPSENPDEVKEPPPLVMLDVQHLLLLGILGNRANMKPRWCRMLRCDKVSKVVAVVLDSVSSEELRVYPESLPTLKQAFDIDVNLIPPEQYGSSVREDLLNVQKSITQLNKDLQKEVRREKHALMKDIKSLKQQRCTEKIPTAQNECLEAEDLFDRRTLLLSSSQILHESIPMPLDLGSRLYHNYVFSKDEYKDVSSQSPLFAVDCEMVRSTASQMDLARVSVINENLETVYDSYVKPRARIIDYVTKFSGITKRIMDSCYTYLEDVQRHLRNILPPDAILCGQSIGGDLKSLKMFHPYLIDTSVIFNLTGSRNMKTGLKRLASHFLSVQIQDNPAGHSSVEDAKTTMQLVKLKLQNGVQYGDLAWTVDGYPDSGISSSHTTNNFSDKVEDSEERIGKKTGTEISDSNKLSSIAAQRGLVLGKSLDGAMSQHKLFFHGSKSIEFLLKRIKHSYKKGIVLDEPEAKKYYPDDEGMVYLDTDKLRQKEAVNCTADKDFCLTHFYAYRDLTSTCITEEEVIDKEEEKKKCLWKLDRKIGKIMTKLPANSLFVVILTGHEVVQGHSAKVFCKITGSVET